MEQKLEELMKSAEAALKSGADPEGLRIKYLGKKGDGRFVKRSQFALR